MSAQSQSQQYLPRMLGGGLRLLAILCAAGVMTLSLTLPADAQGRGDRVRDGAERRAGQPERGPEFDRLSETDALALKERFDALSAVDRRRAHAVYLQLRDMRRANQGRMPLIAQERRAEIAGRHAERLAALPKHERREILTTLSLWGRFVQENPQEARRIRRLPVAERRQQVKLAVERQVLLRVIEVYNLSEAAGSEPMAPENIEATRKIVQEGVKATLVAASEKVMASSSEAKARLEAMSPEERTALAMRILRRDLAIGEFERAMRRPPQKGQDGEDKRGERPERRDQKSDAAAPERERGGIGFQRQERKSQADKPNHDVRLQFILLDELKLTPRHKLKAKGD